MLLRTVLLLAALPLFVPSAVRAQQYRVDSQNLYERMIVVVPLTGAGTYADPRRPLFMPAPGASWGDIISYSWEPTDDGKLAILELVARDRSAFAPILRDARAVKKFVKGQAKAADIEKELQTLKKDFRLQKSTRGPK